MTLYELLENLSKKARRYNSVDYIETNVESVGEIVDNKINIMVNGRWHKVADYDFPTKSGEYITVCKNKNMECGIYLYEISYWTGNKWDNRTHYEDIIAWTECPKYENGLY